MSEGVVDLSQIRGDWKFHMDYLQNAIDQTMKRQAKYWRELGDNDDIDAAVAAQAQIWTELNANANDKGTIPTTDGQVEGFIDACRGAKAHCDSYADNVGSESAEEFAEEFAEACRQIRASHPM